MPLSIVALICCRGVTPTSCQAVTLTYFHTGVVMGHTSMLNECHAEMWKSGHAVVLTCWRFQSLVAKRKHACTYVGTCATLMDCCVNVPTWHIERVHALDSNRI